jgi:hypothetical protein
LLTLDGTSANAITDSDGNRLDGEWVNPTGYSDTSANASNYPSGNGVAGGNFSFAVTILTGDANRDGRVSLADLGALQGHFGKASGAIWEDGDVNGDGKVTAADAALLAAAFGAEFREWPTAAAPPNAAAAIVVASTARIPNFDPRQPSVRLVARPVRQQRPSVESATDRAIGEIVATATTRILGSRTIRRTGPATVLVAISSDEDTNSV